MAKTKIPSSNPIGLRRNELGEVSGTDNSYGFSRAVRGYDPKEVDEYIDNLLDNYRNAQRVLDQNREEFENERELISCEVDGLKSQKAEWEAKIAEYQAVIDDLSNKMVESAGDEAVEEMRKLRDQIKKYERKDAENQEIIDNLSNQLGESQKIINTLNAKSNTNIREVEDLNAKIRELQASVDSSADAEAAKMQLTTENMQLTAQIAELEKANADNAAMVDTLSRENEENVAKVAELTDKMVTLEDIASEYEKIRAEHDDLVKHVEDSEATIENLRNQLLVVNDMVKENEDLRAQINTFQTQMSDYDEILADRDSLRGEFNDIAKENEDLRAQIDTFQTQMNDYDELLADRDSLRNELEGFQSQFDETRSAMKEKDEALEQCIDQLSKLEESISLIQYQIDEAKTRAQKA